ncbi:DBH-like monooxygenase protein 1 [Ylistrum balloti]|uniref:DBH-like monooxygenase protein 1 n=1 Tax=Ylistrum balloti TaxID=509963 RepID=UPI002905A223|nr:DBH-like monooxygenase protein 1 [Ylistrum balloti]
MDIMNLPVVVSLLALSFVHAIDFVDDVRLAELVKEREVRSSNAQEVSKPTPTRHFEHYAQLDSEGNYWLFWTTNDTHVTFETHVNTHGYVGFGISSNGKMFPADVIIGGVKDGQTYFKDYHTTQHAPPIVDQSQDWFLIAGKETASGTVLTFVRKLNTCDSVGDMVITDDTTRIIFSYHPDDVTSYIPYHGATRRGTKSVMLLSSSLTADDVHIPSDTVTFDFLHDNLHVTSDTTTYSCRAFKFPSLSSKHHLIKYEPVVTPGNELHVHHVLIFKCDKRAAELASYDGTTFRCDHSGNVPQALRGCLSEVVIAWAIGGKAFYYPPNAGYSLGTDVDPDFFVMETHYDNPTAKADIVDSSGIRITMTPTLRTHDAGLLQIGIAVSDKQVIPPMEDAFVSQGYCPSEILSTGVPSEGINVFAMVQHSHLLGTQMVTRHYRNGRELEPLAADKHYDFNFQDMRYLPKMKTVLPGDKLEVKCVYDSSHRRRLTLGGLSTQEEMCLSFIAYYPRMPLDSCLSLPLYNTLSSDPRDVQHMFNSWNWTNPSVRSKFQTALDNSIHYHFGIGEGAAVNTHVMTPEHATNYPYVAPEDTRCHTHAGPVPNLAFLGRKKK